jgi:hypothetical protein
VSTDEGLDRLSGMRSLRRLIVRGEISDRGLQSLVDLPDLDSLALHETKVTSQGLRHLASFPKLERLVVMGESLTDEGVETILQQAPRLDLLMIKSPSLTDASLEKLTGFRGGELFVESPLMSEDMVSRVSKALPAVDFFYSGGSSGPIVISGPRRSGKTSP